MNFFLKSLLLALLRGRADVFMLGLKVKRIKDTKRSNVECWSPTRNQVYLTRVLLQS